MWPYIWIAFMLALTVSVIVTAMREKRARAAAVKKLAPQPFDAHAAEASNPVGVDDGFGEPDPLDSFGEDPETANFDEKAFK